MPWRGADDEIVLIIEGHEARPAESGGDDRDAVTRWDSQRQPRDAEAGRIGHLHLDQLGIGGRGIVDRKDRSLLGRNDRTIVGERRRAGNENSEY